MSITRTNIPAAYFLTLASLAFAVIRHGMLAGGA